MASNDKHLFDKYFEYVAESEAPLIYHRWSLIASVGAFLGRRYYLPFGTGKLYPNQYVMLIGNPGTRKSTAIKGAAKVLRSAGYDKFAAERTTKEKFLLDLEGLTDEHAYLNSKNGKAGGISANEILAGLNLTDGTDEHDGIPKEVFVTADEFNEFAGTGNLDFLSTLGALWDWDDESATYKQRFKNSKSISIYQPTISIIGGNTHQSFQAAFPAAAIGQGFLSRLILVHSEPSGKKITFPQKPDEKVAVALGEIFNEIREKVKGEAVLAADAKLALDTIYRTWKDLEDYRFKSYSTRRFTHLLKLCLICSAMARRTVIELRDVVLANTILTFTESSMSKALGEYGKSKHAEATNAIMVALYEAKAPLPFDAIWKLVQRDLERRDTLQDLLKNLSEADKIQYVKDKGFLPKHRVQEKKEQHVNYSLLKELK